MLSLPPSNQRDLIPRQVSLNASSSSPQGGTTLDPALPQQQTTPTLVIPTSNTTVAPASPSAVSFPIAILGALFQVVLNGLGSGVPDTLQGIVTVGIATTKQGLAVSQFYTLHLSNVCEGTIINAADPLNSNLTDPGSFMNITSCPTYRNASSCESRNYPTRYDKLL
jgi:hypothetical protein